MFDAPFLPSRNVIPSPRGVQRMVESGTTVEAMLNTCVGSPPPGGNTASFQFGLSLFVLYQLAILPSFHETAGCVVRLPVSCSGLPPCAGIRKRFHMPF